MASLLRKNGNFSLHEETHQDPSVIIVNTCTVTDRADSRSRNMIRSLARKHPGSKILVTGCYANTDPETLAAIPGVETVFPNRMKTSILPYALGAMGLSGAEIDGVYPDFSSSDVFGFGDVFPEGRVRAILKIQDGCDRSCSYCKVPAARGRGVSRPSSEILEELERMVGEGIPEIVVSGINVGDFRDTQTGTGISALLEKMIESIESGGRSRLRLSSIEPDLIDERLMELTRHPAFCNFLHLPLQSGSERILKLMNRPYTRGDFLRYVEKIRNKNDKIYFGSDVMIGFPGETDHDFLETREVIEQTGISHLHVFRYSPREGTPAAKMEGRVHGDILHERMEALMNLEVANRQAFVRRIAGEVRRGVVESSGSDSVEGKALSDDFLRLTWPGTISLEKGDTGSFRILELLENGDVLTQPV